jgi:hypothetical protein
MSKTINRAGTHAAPLTPIKESKMKAYGLALGLALLLTGCATNTSGVALYGAPGAAAVAEQHQNVNVTLTELSRRQHSARR